jgi:hypothetical protein
VVFGTAHSCPMDPQLSPLWNVLLAEQRELIAVHLHAVGRDMDPAVVRRLRALLRLVAADVAALSQLCPPPD